MSYESPFAELELAVDVVRCLICGRTRKRSKRGGTYAGMLRHVENEQRRIRLSLEKWRKR